MTHAHVSIVDRLLCDLDRIDSAMFEFLDGLDIRKYDAGAVIQSFRPAHSTTGYSREPQSHSPIWLYGFAPLNETSRVRQSALLKQHTSWFEQLAVLFQGAPKKANDALQKANEQVTRLIEQDEPPWGFPSTIEEVKRRYQTYAQPFRSLLGALRSEDREIVIVPDTNALCACTDWLRYAEIAGAPAFSIVILSTVLGELDAFQTDGRKSQDFREKANKVVRIVKGLRAQGALSEGVKVHRTINIRLRAPEPNFNETLAWLDRQNHDDRIVASILELQRESPSSVIVLVTRDINLQNKAEAAKIPSAEPPEPASA
jgi:rRNA-processing protein FCF1